MVFEKSIIVLNKCDLVDEEWLELVEEEVREELEGTFLEHAPVMKVSAATGQGLDALVQEIDHMMQDEVSKKRILQRFRDFLLTVCFRYPDLERLLPEHCFPVRSQKKIR